MRINTGLFFLFFLSATTLCACGGAGAGDTQRAKSDISPAPLFPDGIEPGDPSSCEAPAGSRCWYVDADAANGGDGTFEAPFNRFDLFVGSMNGDSYAPGIVGSGDVVYLRGTFGPEHGPIHFGRGFQSGSAAAPTTIKSYLGTPRAVFDAAFQLQDIITLRALGDSPAGSYRVRNIAFTNADGRAIYVGEHVADVLIEGISVTNTRGDGISGVGGAILFTMQTGLHTFSIQDSFFASNRQSPSGGENNIGAVSVLSEPSAVDGSVVRILNNTFVDENIAIRHKHSGNISTIAVGNRIDSSAIGFYIRAKYSELIANELTNVETAFMLVAENQNSDTEAIIRDNTILESRILLDTGFDETGFGRSIRFEGNYYESSLAVDGIIRLGRYSSNDFNTSDWQSSGNTFAYDESQSTFLYVSGEAFDSLGAQAELGEAIAVSSGGAMASSAVSSGGDGRADTREPEPAESTPQASQTGGVAEPEVSTESQVGGTQAEPSAGASSPYDLFDDDFLDFLDALQASEGASPEEIIAIIEQYTS